MAADMSINALFLDVRLFVLRLRFWKKWEVATMLIITIKVDAPAGQAIGIKEDLAMYLKRFGDSRVVSVEEVTPQQLSLMDKA